MNMIEWKQSTQCLEYITPYSGRRCDYKGDSSSQESMSALLTHNSVDLALALIARKFISVRHLENRGLRVSAI